MAITTNYGVDTKEPSAIKEGAFRRAFNEHVEAGEHVPLLLRGDALLVLRDLPTASVDCVITSPPYWRKREYDSGGLGLERDHRDYIRGLAAICEELRRVLKPAGSFWLNIGDSYEKRQQTN